MLAERPDLIHEEQQRGKITKDYYINEETHQALLRLSIRMKKPVSTIVDEFFIIPLQRSF